MASNLLGSLLVRLAADAGQFESDLGRAARIAEKNAKNIEKKFADMATKIGGAMAAAVAAAATATAALAKQAINTADDFAKMSQKVGVSVEALSTLEYAAAQSGLSVQQLQGGLTKLAKNASDAAAGTGEAIKGFDAMGVSVTDSSGKLKTTEQLLLEVSKKMAGYEDSAQKTALAVQIFGRAGADMMPFLNAGAEGIQELQDRARDLGLEIGGSTAKQAEQFNDLLSDLGRLTEGVGRDIARELLPGLVKLAELFVDNGIKARAAGESYNGFAEGIRTIIGVTISVIAQIEKLGAALGAVAVSAGQLGDLMRDQFAGIQQFQQDVFDIGPVDAYAKMLGTSFSNIGGYVDGVKNNMTLLNETFDQIDEGAAAKIAALGTKFSDTSQAVAGTTAAARAAAPAITDTAKATAEATKRQSAYNKLITDSAKEQTAWIVKQREAATALRDRFAAQTQGLQTEIELLRMSAADREAALIAIEAERLARNDLGVVIDDQREKYKKLLTELKDAQEVDQILANFGKNDGILDLIDQMRDLQDELDGVGRKMGEALSPERANEIRAALSKMNAQLASETIGSFKAVLGTMQQFEEQGSSGFKKIQMAMAALQIVQDILALKAAVTAVLNQGQGDPYSAFARMAAMAAAVAPFIASIGLTLASFGGSSGGGSNGAEARQARQGTGTVLGDAEAKSESMVKALEITADATSKLVGLNRGMLNALLAMQAGIGSASASISRVEFNEMSLARGAAPLLDSGLNTIAGRVWNSIFGGRQELIDQGLLINGGAFGAVSRNPNARAFQTVETDGGWFHSDSVNDSFQSLGEAANAQIRLILESIGDAVREGAIALGLDADAVAAAIEAFNIAEIRISTMGLSGEEAQAELEAVFSSIFDGLAGAVVPWVDQFQRVGEGLGETLIRVATSVQVMREAVDRFGLSFDTSDPELFAQISVGLIELVGGIEQFIDQMSSFVDAFAPETHKFALLQNDLTRAFAEAGLTIPPTRDAMWELMQSLDASTESGREQIATLLRLTDVAAAYYDMLDDAWSDYYEAFYTEFERAERAAAEARAAAVSAFEAIGLSIDGFVGGDGMAAFRQMFEDILPTLAEDQVVIWLAAANALGIFNGRLDEMLGLIDYDNMGPLPPGYVPPEGPPEEPPYEYGPFPGWTPPPRSSLPDDPATPYTPPDFVDIAPDFSSQLADLLDRLRFEDSLRGLSDYERELAQINRQWDQVIQQADDWGALPAELAEMELFRQHELMEAMQRRYDAEMEYVESLRGYVDSLLLDDAVTTLTPQEQLAEARRQYEQLLSSALGGDVAARDQLQGAADTYLRLARGFFGSTDQYSTIFDSVTTGLGELAAAIATAAELQMISTGGESNWTFEPQAMQATFEAAAEPTVDEIRGLREDNDAQAESIVLALQRIEARLGALESPASRTAAGVEQLVVEGKRRA